MPLAARNDRCGTRGEDRARTKGRSSDREQRLDDRRDPRQSGGRGDRFGDSSVSVHFLRLNPFPQLGRRRQLRQLGGNVGAQLLPHLLQG